jgi:hypothetical protein
MVYVVDLRLNGVLRLRRKHSRLVCAVGLVAGVALEGLDVLLARGLGLDTLGEAHGLLAVPLGLAVLAVVLVVDLGQHDGDAGLVRNGVEVLWVVGNLGADGLLPLVPALGLALLDDAQAVARQALDGLAVHARLGHLLELGEGARVVVEQCGARRRVCVEACEARRGAGLEVLAGLDGGEEAGSGPHGCGGSIGGGEAQWVGEVVMPSSLEVAPRRQADAPATAGA